MHSSALWTILQLHGALSDDRNGDGQDEKRADDHSHDDKQGDRDFALGAHGAGVTLGWLESTAASFTAGLFAEAAGRVSFSPRSAPAQPDSVPSRCVQC